jgi:hypothetical protein
MVKYLAPSVAGERGVKASLTKKTGLLSYDCTLLTTKVRTFLTPHPAGWMLHFPNVLPAVFAIWA